MAGAIAEANATRKRTSHRHTLADARRDRDVAMVDARDAYERAIAVAEGNAARAQMHADKRYASAKAWAKTDAARRREAWKRFRFLDDVQQVVQLHSYVGLLVSAPSTDPAKRPEYVAMHRMLGSLLRRRGVTA
jgi:hypothetical protein